MQRSGLTESEVLKQRELYGWNRMDETARPPWWEPWVAPFQSVMTWVLLVAMGLSLWLGEAADAWSILAILILNAVMERIQESRAERALERLKALNAPKAYGLRDGNWQQLAAEELVPGDYIRLQAGDRVPADGKCVRPQGLLIDESMLTGESEAVGKAEDADGYMGTLVTAGQTFMRITATGRSTEMGKIALLLKQTEAKRSPLQEKLHELGGTLVWIALGLTALVVGFGWMGGQPLLTMVMTGVSLAVAAIPEGLPAIVTVVLALGVQRMIRQRAIVRQLTSVETLGCTDVICTDKTGTLTENRMKVTDVIADPAAVKRIAEAAKACSDVQRQHGTDSGEPGRDPAVYIGSPTETALAVWADQYLSPKTEAFRRTAVIPFDSVRKRMTVGGRSGERDLIYMKGAPEAVLPFCTHVIQNGRIVLLTPDHERQIIQAQSTLADQARRVLAFAYRETISDDREPGTDSSDPLPDERKGVFAVTGNAVNDLEKKLIFLGLAGLTDPPREGVTEAVSQCREAGIRTVMITGDHPRTAAAVAVQTGLIKESQISQEHLVITGAQLDAMDEAALQRVLPKTAVFARVTPAHKLRIVQAFRKKQHVVAMTGDGVNDAPALKAADIGVAMGRNGTDVAREASSLVLSDDHFATIVTAVKEGRTIYDNIRKFIRYLLASNVGEIVTMLLAMIAGLPLPLLPLQILWVNLVTDGLPALALGVDQPEKELMSRPPRKRAVHLFADGLSWKIISRGVLIGIFTLIAFILTLRRDGYFTPGLLTDQKLIDAAAAHGQTVAFATLVLAQLIHVFDCRSSRTILHRSPFGNKPLLLAVAVSLALMIPVIYLEPVQQVFKTVPLDGPDLLLVLACAAVPSFWFAGFASKGKRRLS